MRVAIVASPRTGSTRVELLVSQCLRLTDLDELLTHECDTIEEKFTKIKLLDSDNYVVKLFLFNFREIGIHAVNWGLFDLVIFIDREPKVDSFVSDQLAKQRKRWFNVPTTVNNPVDEFTANLNEIENWIDGNQFHLKEVIEQHILTLPSVNVLHLTYNDVYDPEKIIRMIEAAGFAILDRNTECGLRPIGVNYKEKCTNYSAAVEKFKELGL